MRKGAGSRILKVTGTRRKREKFHNISLYFPMVMEQTGENSYGKGRETGVKGTGSGSKRYGRKEFQTPLSPPPPWEYPRECLEGDLLPRILYY